MKKQRILSFLLALVMTVSLLPGTALAAKTEDFTDVSKSDWFYKYVDFVTDEEYFVGTSKTTFSPEMSMTRAMFVVVLAALEGAKVDNNVAPFADVPAGTWYSGAVKWAADNGVVAGVGDNKFAPDTAISREQMAVMMDAYVDWHSAKHGENHKLKAQVKGFGDSAKIASWATEAVENCRVWGLIAGAPDGNYYPQNTATRAEVATVIYNLAWLVYGGGGSSGHSHNYSASVVVTAPTCTEDGYTTYTCSCGKTKTGDVVPALGHDFGAYEHDDADHWQVCSRCVEIANKAAHTWDAGVVTKEATPTSDGEKTYTCTACGHTKVEAIKYEPVDLIYNALADTLADAKAELKKQGNLILDASKLDELAQNFLASKGLSDLVDANAEEGFVAVGGANSFVSLTGVKMGKANEVDSTVAETIEVVAMAKLDTETLANLYAVAYQTSIEYAKKIVDQLSGVAITKELAAEIATELATKFETETGIEISKATVEKAIDVLMATPGQAKDYVKGLNKYFKDENGYYSGNVIVSVNSTEVEISVDTDVALVGSKKDAIISLAKAIAVDLYGDLKQVSEYTALNEIDNLGFTVKVLFSDNTTNAHEGDTDRFPYEYPVNFSLDIEGTVADNMMYKYDGGNFVKFIITDKMQAGYAAVANKLVKEIISPVIQAKMKAAMGDLNVSISSLSLMALAAPADAAATVANFDFDAVMNNAIDAWLSSNLTDGDISNSALMDYLTGKGDASALDNEALYDVIDKTLDNAINDMLADAGVSAGGGAAVSLAGKPDEIEDLIKEFAPEAYEKLEDLGLTDYTIAKAQDTLDPEAETKYTTETIRQDMEQNVSKVVVDTIDNSVAPSDPAQPDLSKYITALEKLSKLTTVEQAGEIRLGNLATALRHPTFQGYVEGRGDAIVDRVADLIKYIPDEAAVVFKGVTIDETLLADVRDAKTTIEVCNAVAAVIDQFEDLCLADFDNDGQIITVKYGSKSWKFGLAIDY